MLKLGLTCEDGENRLSRERIVVKTQKAEEFVSQFLSQLKRRMFRVISMRCFLNPLFSLFHAVIFIFGNLLLTVMTVINSKSHY